MAFRLPLLRRLLQVGSLLLAGGLSSCLETRPAAPAAGPNAAPATRQAATPRQPNIVLIMADDMGISDIGCYGSEIRTPHLDALAAGGLRYSQFYNTARCCPTRACLLTGLYPHQAGVGHMMENRGLPAYQGDLSAQSVTIAQVLKGAGYRTYMAGKWHVTPIRDLTDQHNWPRQRGFDRFFGTIHGAGSFYDPVSLAEDNTLIVPEPNFYYTEAISDHAVSFIREHDAQRPFFMYVAYTAAHWPLHARPRDIAKYRGRYDDGWEVLRRERYARMRELGLLESSWRLSETDPKVPDWDQVPDPAWQAQCMEVYAAMIDNMDQGIGRIVAELKRQGQWDNTLIFYLQDNGACAEQYGLNRKPLSAEALAERHPMGPDERQTRMQPLYTRDGRPVRVWRGVTPGPADTYIGYSAGWANASNTPFRWYKHWVHEGGISSPLIVHWPQRVTAHGKWRHQPAHLIDIMATCVDVSGATYPTELGGQAITPMEGVSLVPTFENNLLHREAIFWEHEGNRAVRTEQWKLVSKASVNARRWDQTEELPLDQWELYDMENDRTETMDLAPQLTDQVRTMAALWQAWAQRVGAVPKPRPQPKR